MTKRAPFVSIVVPLFIFIFHFAVSPAAAAEKSAPALLKFTFTKGDVYAYSIKLDGTGSIGMTHPGAGSKAPMDIPIDISMYFETEIKVDDTDAAGAASLTAKFTRIKTKAGESAAFDSNTDEIKDDFTRQMLDKPIKLKMARDGKIKNIDFPLPKDAQRDFSPLDINEMLEQLWVTLPEIPVAVGDKWKQPVSFDMPMGKAKKITFTYDMELTGYEKVKDIDCAVIKVTYSGDLKDQLPGIEFPPAGAGGMKIELSKLLMTVDGKIFFAPGPGVMMGAHIEMTNNAAGTMQEPGDESSDVMGIKTDIDSEIDIELQ